MLLQAALILVPVVLLGVGLAFGIRNNADHRGLSEARAEAALVAHTAVEPQLDGRPLSEGLTRRQRSAMERLADRAVAGGQLLRLRLRDEDGNVVFSDGSGSVGQRPSVSADGADGAGVGDGDDAEDDDEVIRAAAGETVVHRTQVNADSDDAGLAGPEAVEVYLPLRAGKPRQQVGVLEIYLPYAPIQAEVDDGLHVLFRYLGLGLAGLVAVLFVITLSAGRGLRRQLAANAWMARHDSLTGLANRTLFLEKVDEAARWASRTGRRVVVAIMDLDHFKDLNDTLGHHSGDELLVELARRLDAEVRPPDTIARLGGDEFALVLRGCADARADLARLAGLVSAEVDVQALPLSVAPSIGYVAVTDADRGAETLMRQAEVAMYAAKADHGVIVEYRSEQQRYEAADVELIAEVPRALKAGQFELRYQPQVDTRSGAIVAAEALVRWQHPTHGLLAPDRFLPLAEQTDLIERITEWVLAQALADASHLAAQGRPITIAVNVSARSVVREDFAAQVLDALAATDVPASRLVIELTETALLTNPERARSTLAELQQNGVRISVDDFGQGQTSLGYLADLPVSELKVDRSFVTGMTTDPSRWAIVQSVIELGHNLDMRVVAEGVETTDDLHAVTALGCDLAQGYYLARPMELDALVEILDAARIPGQHLPLGGGSSPTWEVRR